MRARPSILLLVLCLAGYLLTAYGGLRSPDAEVVFRSAQSLARGEGLAVTDDLTEWPGFGVAPGADGRLYPVFGPLQTVLWAPAVSLGDQLAAGVGGGSNWQELPLSYYAAFGLLARAGHVEGTDPAEHLRRIPAALANVLITALGVLVFARIIVSLTGSPVAASITALLYGFGTLAWPYSGTGFREPLATLLVLGAVDLLLQARPARARLAGAGLLVGLAVTAHVTAVLFVPFLAWMAWGDARGSAQGPRAGDRAPVGWFVLGCGLALMGLAAVNQVRFGDPLQTGRTAWAGAAERFQYGHWTWPWEGLWGLALSPGKGLLLYCPAVVLGLLAWRSLHRRRAELSWILGACIAFRFVVIAARSDWHGGFSVGPRLLLPIVPFLLIPAGCWIADQIRDRREGRVLAFTGVAVLCAAQQLYFVVGEPFLFLYEGLWSAKQEAVARYTTDLLWNDWSRSPLLHLMGGRRGPALLGWVGLSNATLWLVGSALLGTAAFVGVRRVLRLVDCNSGTRSG